MFGCVQERKKLVFWDEILMTAKLSMSQQVVHQRNFCIVWDLHTDTTVLHRQVKFSSVFSYRRELFILHIKIQSKNKCKRAFNLNSKLTSCIVILMFIFTFRIVKKNLIYVLNIIEMDITKILITSCVNVVIYGSCVLIV